MNLNALTKHGHSQIRVAMALVLSACESPEDMATRQSQFNGKTLSEVINVIGEPTQKTSQSAVWHYKDTHTNLTPVYRYNQYGKAILVGHNRQEVIVSCTYKATLKSERVIVSDYEGNSCKRFAPKLAT